MKCITCGNKITKQNSYKVDCIHEARICRQCIIDNRMNMAINKLEHENMTRFNIRNKHNI